MNWILYVALFSNVTITSFNVYIFINARKSLPKKDKDTSKTAKVHCYVCGRYFWESELLQVVNKGRDNVITTSYCEQCWELKNR